MKYLFIVLVILLSGCSVLNRSSGAAPQANEDWIQSGGSVTSNCPSSKLSVQYISRSNLAIIGPIVPLIPIWRNDPQFLHLRMEGSDICPSIRIGNKKFDKDKVKKEREGSQCRYKLNKIDFAKEVSIEILTGSGLCAPAPVKYKPTVRWFYMPLASG